MPWLDPVNLLTIFLIDYYWPLLMVELGVVIDNFLPIKMHQPVDA